MPKESTVNSRPTCARFSPYACSSRRCSMEPKNMSADGDEKEWEEARCPICMEHPHNAVLLLCSSREKGCRPYMCDTSHRHSNCLDQFRKSFAATGQQSAGLLEAASMPVATYHRRAVEPQVPEPTRRRENVIICPLCRGHVSGWVAIAAARKLMNLKTRSCSLESCEFSGNYEELRKHARLEHPSIRPAEADPVRQLEWSRMEQQTELDDAINIFHSLLENEFGGDPELTDMLLGSGFFDPLTECDLEVEDEGNDVSSTLMDLDVELSFAFLNDLPYLSLSLEESRGYLDTQSSNRLPSRRMIRSRSRDRDNEEATPYVDTRSSNLLSNSRMIRSRSRDRENEEATPYIYAQSSNDLPNSRMIRSRSRDNHPLC